jgi:isocitrate dehydrogenase (NAD+)
VHGSAPDIAGKGIANPTALLFTSLMMLRHLGERSIADQIGRATLQVLAEGTVLTGDLGGTATTKQYTQAIISKLA